MTFSYLIFKVHFFFPLLLLRVFQKKFFLVWFYYNLRPFLKVLMVPKKAGHALKQDREKDNTVSPAWGPTALSR